jgi:predicted RNase H-like HicB family nuclease
MRTREFTAVIEQEDDMYVAWVEELPGANTQGATLEEVRENLKEAVQLVLEARRELDEQRLKDRQVIREPLLIAI